MLARRWFGAMLTRIAHARRGFSPASRTMMPGTTFWRCRRFRSSPAATTSCLVVWILPLKLMCICAGASVHWESWITTKASFFGTSLRLQGVKAALRVGSRAAAPPSLEAGNVCSSKAKTTILARGLDEAAHRLRVKSGLFANT